MVGTHFQRSTFKKTRRSYSRTYMARGGESKEYEEEEIHAFRCDCDWATLHMAVTAVSSARLRQETIHLLLHGAKSPSKKKQEERTLMAEDFGEDEGEDDEPDAPIKMVEISFQATEQAEVSLETMPVDLLCAESKRTIEMNALCTRWLLHHVLAE